MTETDPMIYLYAFGIVVGIFILFSLPDLLFWPIEKITSVVMSGHQEKRLINTIAKLQFKNIELTSCGRGLLPITVIQDLKEKKYFTQKELGAYNATFRGESLTGYYVITRGISDIIRTINIYDKTGKLLND